MTSTDLTVTNQRVTQRDFHQIRRWLWGVFAFGAFAVSVTGMVVRMPYVVFTPGDASDTEARLQLQCQVEDACLGTFPSDGEIFFTTVSVRQRPSLWEYLWLRTDSDAHVADIELILGDRTPQENDEFNATLMAESKDIAVAVALQRLGYDVIRIEALRVGRTFELTPADGVLEPGDRLLSFGGQDVDNTTELFDVLSEVEPNSEVTITYSRLVDGSEVSTDVTLELGNHPDDASRPYIGIAPVDQYDIVDAEVGVDIDSAEVGGPSAGLAFTLATLDYLTEGDLTGGVDVAVTGTIRVDGSVGIVGGAIQKTAAVRDQGIELFLVPAELPQEELDHMIEVAEGKVEIVPVATLEEALTALDERGGDLSGLQEFEAEGL